MNPKVNAFVESWTRAARDHDRAALLAHFAPRMTFHSPVVYKPSSDRPYIDQIITWVTELIDDFRYTDVYPTQQGAVMVFAGRFHERAIEGVDVFKLDDDGKVSELKVFLRPLNSTTAFAEEMKSRFERLFAETSSR
jgi:hypothetical protein